MKAKAYQKYRQSGVEWLGKVPVHWEVKKTRRCLLEHKQGYYTTDAYVDEGYKLLRITDLDGNGYVSFNDCPSIDIKDEAFPFLLKDDDFVFARTGGAGTFGLIKNLREKVVFASYLIRFRFSKTTHANFLKCVFLSKQFTQGIIRNIHGGVNQNVHAEDIKDQLLCLPPLREQKSISSFLDRETGRIDALISKKQRLVELLKEKRTALISRAVTKGLYPKVKMKPSGVEWLGEVPEHWEVGPLKRFSDRIVVGIAEAATHAYLDEGIPILRATNVRQGRIVGELLYLDLLYANAPERRSKHLFAGDLVTVRTGNAGVTAIVPKELEGCHCFTMLITTLAPNQNNSFFEYYITSQLAQSYFAIEGWGTAQVNISVPIMQNLSVPVPPASEQQSIVSFLDRETSKLDALISKVNQAILTLKEYRTALISAAVTGKIDVRKEIT